jgi:hypothetical protein
MARSPNCTGAPLFKGRVDVSISYPDPDETLLETPVALPTSEPAEAQISYTLASGHMPVWSPYELEHVKTAFMYVGGINTTGATVTVYYRVLKNGVSIATGSGSVATGNYYTWSHYRFLDVVAGDMLSCKLWASSADVKWDYKAVLVWPTRIGPKGCLLANATADEYSAVYTLTLGTPFRHDRGVYYTPFDSDPSGMKIYWRKSLTFPVIRTTEVRGLGCVEFGDIQLSTQLAASATYHPYWYGNNCFKRLSYTPLNLRV